VQPQLILVVGLPGTGKTTLARGIAERLGATFVRIDAVETAIQVARGDHSQVGAEGYFVAHFLARSNLELGRDVVVDAVCPVPASRSGWSDTAAAADASLIIFQTELGDRGEHRRRVEQRTPDMPGQHVPGWADVDDLDWAPWDEARDGHRTIIDTTSADSTLSAALAVIDRSPR
jgi:predicted kinase